VRKYTKDEELKCANTILTSPEWEWLFDRYDEKIAFLRADIDDKLRKENVHGVFLAEGFRMGVEWCKTVPKQKQTMIQRIFDRVREAINDLTGP